MGVRHQVMCEPIADIQPDMCQPESTLPSESHLTACFKLLIGMVVPHDPVLLCHQWRRLFVVLQDNDSSMCPELLASSRPLLSVSSTPLTGNPLSKLSYYLYRSALIYQFGRHTNMNELLIELRQFAEALALDAAQKVREAPRVSAVQEKAAGDWFSAFDGDLERYIRQRIQQTYPDHGFLGEEGGAVGAQGAEALIWVVDPIDGSMNFLRDLPHYAVSIALVRGGEPLVGCVVDPVRGELFSAARGLGAHCNGAVLGVATPERLIDAVAATVFPKPHAEFMGVYTKQLGRVLGAVAGARRSGSMALDLAYLAAGRVDLFWERGMGAWDAAAGVLLIQEAGGEVFTLDGLPWMQSEQIAAATPRLSEAWRSLLTR
jgi:myo-inositol-1(or 4)-monophosphatase